MHPRHVCVACVVLICLPLLSACGGPDHLAQAEEAYRAKDCAAATGHLDEAIGQGTKNSNVYLFRAMVRSFCLGDFETAIDDYDRAIDLIEPERRHTTEVRDAYRGRGMARFMLGEFGPAAQDFATGIDLEPDDAHAWALWALAEARSGVDPTEKLREFASGREQQGWPAPLVRLLLGEIGPDECLAAAEDPDPARTRGNLCEAHFYIAEYLLLVGDAEQALAHFRKSLATGAEDYNEYMLARLELQRLEGRGGATP